MSRGKTISFEPSRFGRINHPVGITPARIPTGSALHAPVLVGENGDVK